MISGPRLSLVYLTCATVLFACFAPSRLQAQGTGEAYEDFRSIVAPAMGTPLADLAPEVLVAMQAALGALTREYPDSNLALQIVLGETVEGIDLAELNRLAEAAAQAKDTSLADGGTTATEMLAESPAAVVNADEAPISAAQEADAAKKAAQPEAVATADPSQSPTLNAAANAAPEGTTTTAAEVPSLQAEEPPAQPTELIFANLPAAVTACLSVGLQSPVELRVQIGISAEGEIVGVPQILNQDQTPGGLREAYLRALLALDGCAPLQSEGGAGVVIVTISPDGFVMSELQTPQDAQIALVEGTTTAATEVTDPSLPAGALLPTDAGTESQLNLSKKDVRQIQARLQAMGFDPNGIDGVLGKGARTAVRAWQAQKQLPETGYLGKAQLELLRVQSEEAYAEWFEVSANKKLIEAKGSGSVRTGRYIDARGCLREPNGRAVPNFKAGC